MVLEAVDGKVSVQILKRITEIPSCKATDEEGRVLE